MALDSAVIERLTAEAARLDAGFDVAVRPRFVFGVGAVDRLGALATNLGLRHVMLVTDAGLVQAGHAGHAQAALTRAGVAVTVFGAVHENPTTDDVDGCAAAARSAGVDGFVAVGGGSSIDCAKGANIILTNGGAIADYWGHGKVARPMLPLVAVPTTAGTGSEAQSYALVSDAVTHRKMACGDPKVAPAVAVLDPALTLSQPREVTACTGLDTIAHAVESAVTRRRNPVSRLFSFESFRRAEAGFERVLDDPDDIEARSDMLLAASFGGMAIEMSMLGCAHALANPLTARFDVVHGHAVGLLLPHVVRFNAEDDEAAAIYADLAASVGRERAPGGLVARLEALLEVSGLPARIGGLGVDEAIVPKIADEAAAQWTAQFNPRAVGAGDLARLYRAAL